MHTFEMLHERKRLVKIVQQQTQLLIVRRLAKVPVAQGAFLMCMGTAFSVVISG